MSNVIELAKQLISQASVTPDDAGCQEILKKRLEKIGFNIEDHPFGNVKNFWARRGKANPLLLFIGHTDVVPTGDLAKWTSPPFKPEIRNGYLYGRGAADMKSGIAAMMIACENFIAKHPQHTGSIAWLITSDEEGPSVDGTAKVAQVLKNRGEKIDYCLVGEASCEQQFGDIIKIGRRGSLSGKLIIHGKQGHVAYPQLADNPIHKAMAALAELVQQQWDADSEFFPATSLQISNIHAGTGAGNVIPNDLEVDFNFRYSPQVTAKDLEQRVEKLLQKHALKFTLSWNNSAQPFLTKPEIFVERCQQAVKKITGVMPRLSTHGGTSDGRFIFPLGAQIVEFGPHNNTIHQIDECVAVKDLELLVKVYEEMLGILM